MEMRETHGLQCLESRTNIWTFIDGTTATVDVNFRVLREPAGCLLQRLQSCRSGSWTGIDCAWNMLTAVEDVESDLQDDRFRACVAGKLSSHMAGLVDLRRRPGVGSGIFCMGGRLRQSEHSNEREGECSRMKFEQTSPVRIHIVSLLRAKLGRRRAVNGRC